MNDGQKLSLTSGLNCKTLQKIFGKIDGEIWISCPVFTLQIEAVVMHEQTSLLRKFHNYRSNKLFSYTAQSPMSNTLKEDPLSCFLTKILLL